MGSLLKLVNHIAISVIVGDIKPVTGHQPLFCQDTNPSSPRDGFIDCSAFTVAELGEMLPKEYKTFKNRSGAWYCDATFEVDDMPFYTHADTEAEARGKMLVYLIENGLISSTQASSPG